MGMSNKVQKLKGIGNNKANNNLVNLYSRIIKILSKITTKTIILVTNNSKE